MLFSLHVFASFPVFHPVCPRCCKEAVQHSVTRQLLPVLNLACVAAGRHRNLVCKQGSSPLSSCLITCFSAWDVTRKLLNGQKGACNRVAKSPGLQGSCHASRACFRQLLSQALNEILCKIGVLVFVEVAKRFCLKTGFLACLPVEGIF